MPAPLNSFLACQIVTLKNAGLSCQKIADKIGLKVKSTAQSVYERYNRNNSYLPKKSTGRPTTLSETTGKTLVTDVLKDPKTSLKKIRVKYISFSTKESNSNITDRKMYRYNFKSVILFQRIIV